MTASRAAQGAAAGAGFTLLELLVVVILAALLGATILHLFRFQTRVFRSENQAMELEQNLRSGIDLMVRELRNAGMRDRLQPYAIAPAVLSADSNAIRFTMDFHSTDDPTGGPDGDVFDGNEDIEYTFTRSDSTVRRRTRGTAGDSGAQPMAENVTRLRFTYFNAAGTALATPVSAGSLASIRRITIRLDGAAPDGETAAWLESDVAPRNLAF